MNQELNIRLAKPEDIEEIVALFHILSSIYEDNTEELEFALRFPSTFVYVCIIQGRVVATATLSLRVVPSFGLVGYIDDVVVDIQHRGKKLGEEITRHCIFQARAKGCFRLQLTCNPTREIANSMYLQIGFRKKDTNVYIFDL